jgi:hypothetical protein
MILWDIDCIEVRILGRHLWRFIDIESHPTERILYLFTYERDRVQVGIVFRKREGDILPFSFE